MYSKRKPTLFTFLSFLLLMTLSLVSENEHALKADDKKTASFELEFVHLMPRTLDNNPTTWARFKVKNTGEVAFQKSKLRVFDTDTNESMYGGEKGYMGTGFHADETGIGVAKKETLEPGQIAYLACNIGPREVKNAAITLTLWQKDSARVVTQTTKFSAVPTTDNADFELNFVEIFPSTIDGKPTLWTRFKVKNTGKVVFRHRILRVFDVDTGKNMYGSFSGKGFHADAETYGVSEKESLKPGETAYIACRIGDDEVEQAAVTLTLSPDQDSFPRITKTINFKAVVPDLGGDFEVSFVELFPSTLDGKPTSWARFKIENTGRVAFRERQIRVYSIDNKKNFYGGDVGYWSKGFHADDQSYGVGKKELLEPGETAYVACNVGPNEIKNAALTLTLTPGKNTFPVVRRTIHFLQTED